VTSLLYQDKKEVDVTTQNLFVPKIGNSVISLPEVLSINRQDNLLQFMSLQSLKLQPISFIQSYPEGDEDYLIVPPN
jgi:hypothetical protein